MAIKKIRSWVRRNWLNTWCLEGKEKHSGVPIKIVYMGSSKNKNYIKHLVYGGQAEESSHGRRWLRSFPNIHNEFQNTDIAIFETETSQKKNIPGVDLVYIPCWVVGHLAVSDVARLAKGSKSIKEDLRKIRKYDLDYEISRDKSRFDEFYHEMYVPYISSAHGDRAVPMSYDVMMDRMGASELLLIKRESEYIAGEILVYDGESVRAWSLGVRNGDNSYIKMGVVGAMYCFRNEYLLDKGYNAVNIGASRAFLDDGVLQYKKKWGLSLDVASGGGLHVHVTKQDVGAKSFFLNNPFISVVGDEFVGVIFSANDPIQDQTFRDQLHRKYYIDGMGGLDIRSGDELA